jgi:type VI secretion system secreted protein Hcp
MPTQIYATVTGAKQGPFKGELTQKPFDNKIPGVGLNFGVISPYDSASGHATGKKRQHQPIVFTKEWGVSSPQFYIAAYTNEMLTTVLFEIYTTSPAGIQRVDHTVKLTNATVSAVLDTLALGESGGPVIDTRDLQQISFVFQKIEITSVIGGTSAIDDWSAPVT